MSTPTAGTPPEQRGFPFVTVLATFITLFAFLGLTVLVYRSPNYLGDVKSEPKPDPASRLNEIRAKNQAVLDGNPGTGAKTSVAEATTRLLGKLKSEKDKLPFPTPEPSLAAVKEPAPKN